MRCLLAGTPHVHALAHIYSLMSIDFHEGEKLFSHIYTQREYMVVMKVVLLPSLVLVLGHTQQTVLSRLWALRPSLLFFFFFPKEGGLVSESHSPHYYPFASSRIFTYTHIWLVTQLEKVWTKADTHTHTHT